MSSDVRRIDPPAAGAHPGIGEDVDLTTDVGPVHLATPVLSASGCFASGAEIDRFHDVRRLGAVVVKSVTLEPREGLPTPRMAETASGMLNAIGLQNPGIDAWMARDLAWLQEHDIPTVVSIAGKSVEEFAQVARRLRRARSVASSSGRHSIVALEINLSCPNVEQHDGLPRPGGRGLVFACDPGAAAEVVAAVRREADVPVWAKLTSDVTDVVSVARAVVEAGADGLTLINTVLGMGVDAATGRPELSNTYGGLSGPAIKPIALRNLHQVRTALPDVPLVGCGGARTATDVVEFVRAGASAVQIGTAAFVDPFVHASVTAELRRWCVAHDVDRLADLRGRIEPWPTPHPSPPEEPA